MTTRLTGPYQAIETDERVILIMEAPPLDSGLKAVMVRENHGLEAMGGCGARMRFGNLHPRLEEACGRKPVAIATMQSEPDGMRILTATMATIEGDRMGDDPSEWFPESFVWFLGPLPKSMGTIRNEALPRLMALAEIGVTAVIAGRHDHGPPIGLCLHSRRMVPIHEGRRWGMPRPGLFLETGLIDGTARGERIGDDISASVRSAFSANARTGTVGPVPPWLPQLALFMPGPATRGCRPE